MTVAGDPRGPRFRFTLEDFLEQLRELRAAGPLQELFESLPFSKSSVPEGFQVDEKGLDRTEAILSAMTAHERSNTFVFLVEPERINRIAGASRCTESEVRELLRQFAHMREMTRDLRGPPR